MCYSNHSHFFTLQQLRATTQAGGVSGVVLKAQGDAFFIEIEMRSGHYAVLVTARGKEPRRFKNPLRALAILRDIGIVNGQFDLSLYAPEQLNTNYQPAGTNAVSVDVKAGQDMDDDADALAAGHEHPAQNQLTPTARPKSKPKTKRLKAAPETTAHGLQQMKLL
ncbi:MAG TPA: hypothetical protein VK051_01385 [Paenalcaligenes sp.]|nr:hypothetical protein [Paenalcaligenes sp.]